MFLSTLLSDAAAQHGHEFSAPRPSTPTRLSPLPRTIRPQSARQRPPLAALPKSAVKPASSPVATKVEKVMFAEEAEVQIVDAPRRSLSESSEEDGPASIAAVVQPGYVARTESAKTKRLLRSKTSYNFAHAPPKVNPLQKLRSRPPAVLQLHEVCLGLRPKPAFEVFPSGRYAAKLGRHLAKLHKGKDRLGTDDVVVVKAQEYDAPDDDLDSQEVVGIVCASCKDEGHASGNAQLCLEDGSTWEAIPHPKGRYDFIAIDEYGNTRIVRWVPRRIRGRQRPSTTATSGPSMGPAEEFVYRFSTIDPRSRRHPVIANMTPTNLELSDLYYMPRPSPPANSIEDPAGRTSSIPSEAEDTDLQRVVTEREPIETTPLLKSLILLSGVFVALRNGWSPSFAYKTSTGSSNGGRAPSRTNSMRSNNPSPAPSINNVPTPASKRNTWGLGRRATSGSATPNSTRGALSQALGGGSWNATSSASPDFASYRSITPESHRAPADTLLPRLMRSATDRWTGSGGGSRHASSATMSSGSTALEGHEWSGQSSGVGTVPQTPTPTGARVRADEPTEPFGNEQRAATFSGGFLQRASSLRRHWRNSSTGSTNRANIVSSDGHAGIEATPAPFASTPQAEEQPDATHRRRFSFSRGRSVSRHEKSLSMVDNRPPTAFNSQWWVDWGRARPGPDSAPAMNDSATTAAASVEPQEPIPIPALQAPIEKPRRQSLSLRPWRRNETKERPMSMSVADTMSRGSAWSQWGVPGWDGTSEAHPATLQKQGTPMEKERGSMGGFGGIVRRVTHRLRREDRKIS